MHLMSAVKKLNRFVMQDNSFCAISCMNSNTNNQRQISWAEMIEEGSYATILRNAFKRQEALLEEFTRIEKLSADELL